MFSIMFSAFIVRNQATTTTIPTDSRIKRKLQPSLANAENNEAILQALFVRESNVKSN